MKPLLQVAMVSLVLVTFPEQTAALDGEGACKSKKLSVGQRDFAVTPEAKQLVPLFMNWALKGAPLPGQPTEKDAQRLKLTPEEIRRAYRFPDTDWVVNLLKTCSAKVVYISWNANGEREENRFQWKYDLSTGHLKPLSAEDCLLLDKRWGAGGLTCAEQAGFWVKKTKDGKRHVSFSIGVAAGDFELEKKGHAYVLTAKPPVIGIY